MRFNVGNVEDVILVIYLGHVNDQGGIVFGGLVDDVDHLLKDAIWHVLIESPGRAGAAAIGLGVVEDLGGEKRILGTS